MSDIDEVQQKSFILVTFTERNSVERVMNTNKVSPLQMLAVSQELEVLGKNLLIEEYRKAAMKQAQYDEMNKIEVPKPGIDIKRH